MEESVTLIVGGGELPSSSDLNLALESVDRVVVTDGGMRHLRTINKHPDLLVGDMDSITKQDLEWARDNSVEIVQLEQQQDSDLAKALDLCHERGWDSIVVTAISAGRPDHSLAALAALAAADQGMEVGCHLDDTFVFRFVEGAPGTFSSFGEFSLFSSGTSKVSLRDCKWELDGYELGFSSRGLSNFAEGDVELSVESGDPVLVFINL